MKGITSLDKLEKFAGAFVTFKGDNNVFEIKRCLLINEKPFGKVSRKIYQYEDEPAYRFSILRKDSKLTEYCYLNDAVLKKITLKMDIATDAEIAQLKKEIPERANKFAAGECFAEGCEVDELPDTDLDRTAQSKYTSPVIFPKARPFDKLDDNIMLWAVIGHLGYKFYRWIRQKPSEILPNTVEDNDNLEDEHIDTFAEKIHKIIQRLDEYNTEEEEADTGKTAVEESKEPPADAPTEASAPPTARRIRKLW